MKTNISSWLSDSFKRFVCVAALPVLFCATTTVPLQAQPYNTTLYCTAEAQANANPNLSSTWWSTTDPVTTPGTAWVQGDYAYIGTPGSIMPGALSWGQIQTPGLTFDAQGSSTTCTIHGSTLNMDAAPNSIHPGYCTLKLINSAVIFGQNSTSGLIRPDTNTINLPSGETSAAGLYLAGDGTSTLWLGDRTGEVPANFWAGSGSQTIVVWSATIPNIITGHTITLGDNNPINNSTFAGTHTFFRGSGAGQTLTITNSISIMGNTVLDNGSGDAALTFTGPVTLAAGLYTISCNANTINMNGNISGPGGMNFDEGNNVGAGWGTFSLNGNNTYTGGTSLSTVSARLTAASAGSLGMGNVTINSGILHMSSANAMSPCATLDIEGSGTVELGYSGVQYIVGLTYDGTPLPPGSYYDAVGSDTNPNGIFSGTGQLYVTGNCSPITITSETITGGQLQVCWTSVVGVGYNVLTNIGLPGYVGASPNLGSNVAQSWPLLNSTPIIATDTNTCYTLPGTATAAQVYVVIQQ